MKFLHTSDWHFGRKLHQADLTDAYALWGDHVVQTAQERALDAVLISGDVFDRAIAPKDMLELFSDVVDRLLEISQVVITSGNHDSAARLGFLAEFTGPNLHIRTHARNAHEPIRLYEKDGSLGALCYAVPFVDPFDPDSWAVTDAERNTPHTQKDAMGAVLQRIALAIDSEPQSENGIPRILMAHTFCLPALRPRGENNCIHALEEIRSHSEAELPIAGGVEAVPSYYFRLGAKDEEQAGCGPLDYVALGHIHRMYPAGTREDPEIHYCGSPVAFSFSEENDRKGSLIVDFTPSPPNGSHGSHGSFRCGSLDATEDPLDPSLLDAYSDAHDNVESHQAQSEFENGPVEPGIANEPTVVSKPSIANEPTATADSSILGTSTITSDSSISGKPTITNEFSLNHSPTVIDELGIASTSPDNHGRTATFKPTIEFVPAPVLRPLKTIEGTLDAVLSSANDAYVDAFVRIFITDPSRPDHLFQRLEQKFHHILHVEHIGTTELKTDEAQNYDSQSPIDVISEFFRATGGRKLNADEMAIITTAWDALEHERSKA